MVRIRKIYVVLFQIAVAGRQSDLSFDRAAEIVNT